MNKLSQLFFISVLFTSCSMFKQSSSLDHKILINQNNLLKEKNILLIKKIKVLETSLEKQTTESIAKLLDKIKDLEIDLNNREIVFNSSKITTPIIAEKIITFKSQLLEFEELISNDVNLSSKFQSFKKRGVEKVIKLSSETMRLIITEALSYKGTRYAMGGLNYSGIDCSGLLYVSFKANGINNIARTAEEFARYGSIIININDLKEGDLIFFTNTYRTSKLVTHVGICIGNNKFIHASSSKGVITSRINDPYYWREKFLFGTRIIN